LPCPVELPRKKKRGTHANTDRSLTRGTRGGVLGLAPREKTGVGGGGGRGEASCTARSLTASQWQRKKGSLVHVEYSPTLQL